MLNAVVNYAAAEPRYASWMETMGDRIRTLRKSRKLSQERLAKIVGVSGAAIAQWESGATTGIKPENFLRFCAHFGADPFWVVFGDNPELPARPPVPPGRRSAA